MQEKDVLLLPNKAFTFKPMESDDKSLPQPAAQAPQLKDGQKLVWTLDNNRLMPVAVVTGATNGVKTQILSGLSSGAVVAFDYSTVAAAASQQDSEHSPFAPQPPGRNKKK